MMMLLVHIRADKECRTDDWFKELHLKPVELTS